MSWSKDWNASKSPRKQRNYRTNAPLHIKQKFLNVHLSKELREKYGTRKVRVRKGDKVKIMRGQFSKKSGKVDRVSVVYEKIYVEGIEIQKKDGSKAFYPMNASNLMITDLNLDDKKRKLKIERNIKKKEKK
jgi:large subunit ribosomal protein L24